MRAVIFTSFSDLQKAYSLNIVVQNQIKMLLLAGYEPTVIVHKGLKPVGIYADPRVTIEEIPNVACHNEVRKDETFDQDVDAIAQRLREILKEGDVVLTHDIIYQNACLKHNFAARKVSKEMPSVKWFHWIHSATAPGLLNKIRPIFSDEYVSLVKTPFPNSLYVYPNSYAVPAVARNFGISESDIRVVPHPTDICEFFGFDKDLESFIYQKNILNADVICTYPARLDRGKQVEYVIKTIASIKDRGLSVRLIVVDFHSTGGDKVTYREELKQIGIDWGLNDQELTFLSEYRDEWKHEVDPQIVANLQTISNVFVMPSVSETYSLVAQEAAISKQVVVLNGDFAPFRAIYGSNAIYRKFSSRFDLMADLPEAMGEASETVTKYGSQNLPDHARLMAEKDYHRATAAMIEARLKHQEMALSIKHRKNNNLQTVFRRDLEPLFYE